jgi:HSP20 family protein
MTSITRFDPFSDLVNFAPFGTMEAFFPRGGLRSVGRDLPPAPEIKMDVSEDDKVYRVKAEVPGVKKEDIHVVIDGNQVSISAEVKKESEEKKNGTVLRSERYYGMQSRSFSVMHDIDEAKAEAKCQDGVLELTLPKKSAVGKKSISVQ